MPHTADTMGLIHKPGVGPNNRFGFKNTGNNKANEKAPPGREKQVKALKKKFKDKGAPYAIAWAQHNKHGKPSKEAAGVGIVTKQNATKDVPVGGQYMNVKKLKLDWKEFNLQSDHNDGVDWKRPNHADIYAGDWEFENELDTTGF